MKRGGVDHLNNEFLLDIQEHKLHTEVTLCGSILLSIKGHFCHGRTCYKIVFINFFKSTKY